MNIFRLILVALFLHSASVIATESALPLDQKSKNALHNLSAGDLCKSIEDKGFDLPRNICVVWLPDSQSCLQWGVKVNKQNYIDEYKRRNYPKNICELACKNYSGEWNYSGIFDKFKTNYLVELRQSGCKKIQYIQTTDVDDKTHIDKTFNIKINNQWECVKAKDGYRQCDKARWLTNNNLLISDSTYGAEEYEECLILTDILIDTKFNYTVNTSYSCPNKYFLATDNLKYTGRRKEK